MEATEGCSGRCAFFTVWLNLQGDKSDLNQKDKMRVEAATPCDLIGLRISESERNCFPVRQEPARHATMISLSFLSGQQRALAMLAAAGSNGLTQRFLAGCDLGVGMVDALVEKGFVNLTLEKVRGGSKTIEVSKVRITEAGRKALDRKG